MPELFNPDDFQSIQLRVQFENLTTRWQPKDLDFNEIKILEIGDKQLTISLPLKSCNIQHSVMLKVERFDHKAKTYKEIFSATAKIISAESEKNHMVVQADLIQYEEKCWTDLLSIYTARQDEINNFLTTVKS